MDNTLGICFSTKISKSKIKEYINFYNLIEDEKINNLLKDLYRRGYTLPQPYLNQAQKLCAFGR